MGSDSDRLLSRSRDPDLFFISVSVLMHANKLSLHQPISFSFYISYSLTAPARRIPRQECRLWRCMACRVHGMQTWRSELQCILAFLEILSQLPPSLHPDNNAQVFCRKQCLALLILALGASVVFLHKMQIWVFCAFSPL